MCKYCPLFQRAAPEPEANFCSFHGLANFASNLEHCMFEIRTISISLATFEVITPVSAGASEDSRGCFDDLMSFLYSILSSSWRHSWVSYSGCFFGVCGRGRLLRTNRAVQRKFPKEHILNSIPSKVVLKWTSQSPALLSRESRYSLAIVSTLSWENQLVTDYFSVLLFFFFLLGLHAKNKWMSIVGTLVKSDLNAFLCL